MGSHLVFYSYKWVSYVSSLAWSPPSNSVSTDFCSTSNDLEQKSMETKLEGGDQASELT